MKDETNVVTVDTSEKDVKEVKPINLRVQRFLLLSCKFISWDDKKTKAHRCACSVLLVDAADCAPFTGQPIVDGKIPVISFFTFDPNDRIRDLEATNVFTPVFAKISGNENFLRLHDILNDADVEAYRRIVGTM